MVGRRDFLRAAALAASARPGSIPGKEAEGGPAPAKSGSAAEPVPDFSYPRQFSGRQLAMIAFPLGGVAAGSIGLGGRGQLRDWEIFNHPDKGRAPNYAFASIRARVGTAEPVTRVLESRLMPPYEAWGGLSPERVSGLARLESATFTGEYPLAKIAFEDRDLPVEVALEAFTPIIPLDAEASGLPVAILRYVVTNPASQAAQVSIAFSLDNPVGVGVRGEQGARGAADTRSSEYRESGNLAGLLMTNPGIAQDAPLAGSFALCVAGPGDGRVTHLRGWPRAKWWASPLLFWDDFSADGQLGPEAAERNHVGSVCLQRTIAPGAKAEFTFLLAWHFPNRTTAFGWDELNGDTSGLDPNAIIGNYYCRQFPDAWAAAEYAAHNLPSLERRMHQFLAAMRESTLPAAVKEAAMANLSTLATPTCFRTADGKFRAFEGITDDRGCCPGNCTHVWNYETTTQFLFPSLARSMREAAFELADRLHGMLPIRLALPEGHQTRGTTAADGTMGQIIKTFIDWQLCGDRDWLLGIWPKVRKALEFAWIAGGWDGDRDGVLEGVQHNTYDVEFYGPNPMCGVYYLGALRACEEMARAVGDVSFASECRRLFDNGSRWIDANLFNGQYYVQKIRGIPRDRIAAQLRSTGGAEDPEHPDFQLGEGCLADQLIGQYLADIAGLGPLLAPANIRTTLASIHRYNYRSSLERHDSVQRVYALNDEAAVLICDYGAAARPRIPFPYYAEAWTGIEYLFATQLLFSGKIDEGMRCYRECPAQVRRRAAQSLGRVRMRPPLRARHVGVVGYRGAQRVPLSGGGAQDCRGAACAPAGLPFVLVGGRRMGRVLAVSARWTHPLLPLRARGEAFLPLGGTGSRDRAWSEIRGARRRDGAGARSAERGPACGLSPGGDHRVDTRRRSQPGSLSMAPARPLIVVVGGFLGAGKTTLLLRAAALLEQAGYRVGLITNDQGSELVDTRLAATATPNTEEVAGGCFCCRFSDFLDAADRLRAYEPDVILAEPVGSCIDIVATVLRPLGEYYRDQYRLAPFTVLVEPQRARELLARDADPHLAYLFTNQLAEADLVCFSRADACVDFPALPAAYAFRLSGTTGEGVGEWLAEVLADGRLSGTRPLPDVDYGRYAAAEAALGWMNWHATLLLDRALSPAQVVGPFLDRLDEVLSGEGIAIAHLKIFDEAPTGHIRASLCRNNQEPLVDGMLDASPAREHDLVLNLRACGSPEQLEAALKDAARQLPGDAALLHFECFRPAPPQPQHRIGSD